MAIFLEFVSIFIASSMLSGFLTKVVRNGATRFGLAAGPTSSHHIHRFPIPRLGGVAIFCTFVAGYIVYFSAAAHKLIRPPNNSDVLKLLVPAAFLFLAGLIDDLKSLTPRIKLLVEIVGGGEPVSQRPEVRLLPISLCRRMGQRWGLSAGDSFLGSTRLQCYQPD